MSAATVTPPRLLPEAVALQRADELLHRLRAQGIAPRGVSGDSRRVQAGDLFLAYPGQHVDGRRFIAEALTRGAVAVLCAAADEKVGDGETAPMVVQMPRTAAWCSETTLGSADGRVVPCLAVADPRVLAGALAHRIYGEPSHHLWLAGITGTNGKTSVSQWLTQALQYLGRRCAVIGTLGSGFPGALRDSGFTTPDAPSLQATLAELVARGATDCAMEVSSIGLAEGRAQCVAFDVAIVTNLTRDHLDYHHTMADYAAAKALLFATPGLATAVLNLDDAFGMALLETLVAGKTRADEKPRIIGYTLDAQRARPAGVDEWLVARELALDGGGLRFLLDDTLVAAPLIGRFNAANLLAVIGALRARGEPLTRIAPLLRELQAPPGRLQAIGGDIDGGIGSDEPLLVVDYAHSPDALEKALEALREIAAARGGKLWCVFGCGGDRDAGKRPQMGAVAERLADAVILTSDNPRHENPQAIVADILAGMRGASTASAAPTVELDRARAIALAVNQAAARDVILLAGKGHETYQEIAGARQPFADAEAGKSALAGRRQSRSSMDSVTSGDAA